MIVLRLKNTEREDILTGLRMWVENHGPQMVGDSLQGLLALIEKIYWARSDDSLDELLDWAKGQREQQRKKHDPGPAKLGLETSLPPCTIVNRNYESIWGAVVSKVSWMITVRDKQ
jgi:hypothetical protein